MKTKIVKPFHHVLSEKNAIPEAGCVLVPMSGHARLQDFYLCVPESGLYFRSANICKYGCYMQEVFADGEFMGACRISDESRVKKLYASGTKSELSQYISGYMLFRETSVGGKKINKYKEAARVSHELCCEPGKLGHDIRQEIRKQILF